MHFIDETKLYLTAGSGGSGASHFRREKFVPFGGPDGGDGGDGGSIYFKGDTSKITLFDLQHTPNIKAKDGKPGEGNCRHGKSGDDITVKVPLGTQIYNFDDETLIADIIDDQNAVLIAKGGRGGKGNDFFKSATNQTPTHCQPGEPGKKLEVKLSLKLIANVGLIGMPNAGKSTLISKISSAKPKIGDYPFTTLIPSLGVVKWQEGKTFVVADIPGLIPGAHSGKGLGIQFLKHIERTNMLVHILDLGCLIGATEYKDLLTIFNQINSELTLFSPDLLKKLKVVVLNKKDLVSEKDSLDNLIKSIKSMGYVVFSISGATGDGVHDLVQFLGKSIEQLNKAS